LRTVAANITTPAAAPNVVFNLNGGSVVALGAGGYGGTLANFFAGAGTVNVANTNTLDCGAYNLTITNALVGGAADLIKTGSGSLTLNGLNTYTGSTVVSNGTLAGSGSLAGPVALRSGTKLAPGGASIGVLTVGNDLTLSAGASASFRINTTNAVATNDYLVVTGTQSISSSTLTVTNLGPAIAPDVQVVFPNIFSTNVGTMRPGETRTVIRSQTTYTPGFLSVTAQVVSAAPDPNPTNNTAQAGIWLVLDSISAAGGSGGSLARANAGVGAI
jgi:autotransporter-associated beta strand protein